MRGFILLQKSFSHLYILTFLWSSWSYPEWNEWKYVSVVEQIGLNVLNAKCLETGILSRDNPPHGLNTVSQELTQTQEFLEPKSLITLHLLFQEMVNSKMSISITMSLYRTLLQSTSWLPLIQVYQWVVGLPWGLPWTAGSQQANRGEAWHGRWRCVGCRGAEGPLSLPGLLCTLDPGNGQAPAALGAGPVTSRPVEGGNSGGACRGQAGPGEHWGPQPTQGQREEGVVTQSRLKNIVCICTVSGIFLSHPESVSNVRYCSGVQYDDWVRGKPEIPLRRICYCSVNDCERCIYVSGSLCNMKVGC